MSSLPARITDPRRLAAVRATELLDTSREEAFDRLTHLAATLLDAPHAFMTLVDERRSFWKSAIGVGDVRENLVEESFCQYVIATDEPLIVGDAAHDERTRLNPSIASMGVAAWAGVPFHSPDGEPLGSFCVVDTKTRRWGAREREILETLAESATAELALRAALAAERSARAEADVNAAGAAALARTLQESLLPPVLPAIPGLQVAARYRPAGTGVEVVGDFYDVFQSGRTAWNVVIGDVTGKGIEAARITALAHYTLRAAAMRTDTPSRVLATLNRALLEQASVVDPRFLTAIHLSFEPGPDAVRITACGAGHEPPLLRRRDGSVEFVHLQGTLLGVVPEPQLEDVSFELRPGDQLLLYTDGVIDARSGSERLGLDRLQELVVDAPGGGADALADAVDRGVMAFNAGALPDDAAIVALEARP